MGQSGGPTAYYSEEHRCWFVPVSPELFDSPDKVAAEPVRVEIRDGMMWITRLSPHEGCNEPHPDNQRHMQRDYPRCRVCGAVRTEDQRHKHEIPGWRPSYDDFEGALEGYEVVANA